MNPRPFKIAQVMQMRFSHARLSSTVRPEQEKFIISRATEAVTIAGTVFFLWAGRRGKSGSCGKRRKKSTSLERCHASPDCFWVQF